MPSSLRRSWVALADQGHNGAVRPAQQTADCCPADGTRPGLLAADDGVAARRRR